MLVRALRTAAMTSTISELPLSANLITKHLTPDPYTPSAFQFRTEVLTTNPSVQRRARLISPDSHYSHVTPLPLGFPYEIPTPEDIAEVTDKNAYVERWLADKEAVVLKGSALGSGLGLYYPKDAGKERAELIGLSETGLRDCLPGLDVGDAFTVLGAPSLSNKNGTGEEEGENEARKELVDVLSGRAVLMGDEETAFAPWSLRYSGHQFGSWAGQLGDGRAISILVTPHPSGGDYELQLKGAGRTPYSRSADGLAVLRSSIREYLCSEAMHALGIPTTRSLALISLPDLEVYREKIETACVLTRMAPSFIRIGSFEALSPPTSMFFYGGGQQAAHWDALRILGEWTANHVLKLDLEPGEAWGTKLVMEVAKRNAIMVAGWQAYGFMHGVMNTDNISILGLTIDYGPYAFMDVFDPLHVCNHTDAEGRYAYKFQPNMIVFALRALLNALAPLIGAEHDLGGKAVSAGWGDEASEDKIKAWREKGNELVKEEMERVIEEMSSVEYGRLMRKRLALRRQDPTDESKLSKPLLDIMKSHSLDFHSTFRKICHFTPSLLEDDVALQKFIGQLLELSPEQDAMDHGRATKEWLAWLDTYVTRIKSEADEWAAGDIDGERRRAALGANPRFVLRQWVLEETIKKVEADSESGKRVLAKVMHMACNPFEPWGGEDEPVEEIEDVEIKEEQRYCGMGDKRFLGFQCSCSS